MNLIRLWESRNLTVYRYMCAQLYFVSMPCDSKSAWYRCTCHWICFLSIVSSIKYLALGIWYLISCIWYPRTYFAHLHNAEETPGIRQSGRLRSLPSSLCEAEKHLHADPKPVQIKEESQLCPIAGEGGRDTKSLNRFQLRKCALNPVRMSCCQNGS